MLLCVLLCVLLLWFVSVTVWFPDHKGAAAAAAAAMLLVLLLMVSGWLMRIKQEARWAGALCCQLLAHAVSSSRAPWFNSMATYLYTYGTLYVCMCMCAL